MMMNCRMLLWISLIVLAVDGKKLIIDLIRHGARTPLESKTFFPKTAKGPRGSLTPTGQRQLYLLGRLRRQAYIENKGVLPSTYDPALIYVRSTNYNRTLMSAQSYLLGLYPSGLTVLNSRQQAKKSSTLLPQLPLSLNKSVIDGLGEKAIPYSVPMVPIFTVHDNVEQLLLLENKCPYLSEKMAQYCHSSEFTKQINMTYDQMWSEITKSYPQLTRDIITTDQNSIMIADEILSADAAGERPEGLSDAVVESMLHFHRDIMKAITSSTQKVTKIGVSQFTKEVIGRMEAAIGNTSAVQYTLYSAHDSTLAFLLSGLRLLNSSISFPDIPFASNLLFPPFFRPLLSSSVFAILLVVYTLASS